MKFFTLIAAGLWVVPAVVSAAPAAAPEGEMTFEAATVKARSPEEDWKTAIGWDGKVSKYEGVVESVKPASHDGEGGVEKRNLGGVYACQNFNWNAPCVYLVLGKNVCTTWTNAWRYSISVVGPDSNTWCVYYQSTDCSWGGSSGVTHPGGNLAGSYWGQWNDNMGSIKCWW